MLDGFLSLPVMAVAAFFTVSYFVNPGTIIIEKMSVPQNFDWETGYTGYAVAGEFTRYVSDIAEAAGTNRGNRTTELTAQGRSVEALSDWFGLGEPIRSTQVALGFLPYTFSGKLIKKGDALTLKVSGESPAYWDFVMSEKGSVDDVSGLLKRGAIRLMEKIDPYLVAVYHFREEKPGSGYPETKASIDYCLVHVPRQELPWVYALAGDVLRREGKYEEAVVKFRQALLLNPQFARPMMRWGNALADQGQHEDAIGRYKKTLEIEPVYPEAVVAWADSLDALGQHDAARVKYEEAVAMDPQFPRILFAYGKYLARNGEAAKAAEYLRQALHLDGDRNPVYVAELRKVQRQVDPVFEEMAPLANGISPR